MILLILIYDRNISARTYCIWVSSFYFHTHAKKRGRTTHTQLIQKRLLGSVRKFLTGATGHVHVHVTQNLNLLLGRDASHVTGSTYKNLIPGQDTRD